jgi:hypothetical protein
MSGRDLAEGHVWKPFRMDNEKFMEYLMSLVIV